MNPELQQILITYLKTLATPERQERIESVLAERTRHITVVLEDLYQPHNISAVMRSCEGFGIQDIHTIENANSFTRTRKIDMGAQKWLTLYRHRAWAQQSVKQSTHAISHRQLQLGGTGSSVASVALNDKVSQSNASAQHATPEATTQAQDIQKMATPEANTRVALTQLKKQGYQLVATTPPSDRSIKLDDFMPTKPSAILFGTELTGLSDTAMELADVHLTIPMYGFVESFNISVACAVILQNLTSKLRRMAQPVAALHDVAQPAVLDDATRPEAHGIIHNVAHSVVTQAHNFAWQLSEAERAELRFKWLMQSVAHGDKMVKHYAKTELGLDLPL